MSTSSLIDYVLSRGNPTIGVFTGRAQNLMEPDHFSFKYIFDRLSTTSKRNRVEADKGETVGRSIADKGATVGRTTVVPTIAMHDDNYRYNINEILGIMTGLALGWPAFNVQRKLTGELAGYFNARG
jgi:hypothetical protein